MGRNLDDIIDSLPKERQKKIKALATQKVEDMIAHAETLTDFRKAVGKTQAQVAKDLGIKQHAVSQLEKRSDTYVSTLRRFLKTLDLSLELSVVAKDGTRISLPNFLPGWDVDVDALDAVPPPSKASVKTRKPVSGPVKKKPATGKSVTTP